MPRVRGRTRLRSIGTSARKLLRLVAHAGVVAATFAGLSAPAVAQGAKPPSRPRLARTADTNDAAAYLALAERELDGDPTAAARAFYWVARLDPANARAYYGQRVATFLSDELLQRTWYNGSKDADDRQRVRALDSLMQLATLLDPFLHLNLEQRLPRAYFRQQNSETRALRESDILREFEAHLIDYPPWVRGMYLYSKGSFSLALLEFEIPARRGTNTSRAFYHALRARMFYALANTDSALAEYREAIALQRKEDVDPKGSVLLYQPKALYEHAAATVLENLGRLAEAREGFGRAIVEDLGFYPAHVRLAALALAAGDTTTAISELALASQIATHNPVVLYQYAYVLILKGHEPEAVEQLHRAATVEPYYAEPHLLLARLFDASDLRDDAIASYTRFLALASRDHPRRLMADQRLAALKAPATPSVPVKP